MSRSLRIEISDELTSDVIHRVRNFGEDILLVLRGRGEVDAGEIDAATTTFWVRNIARSDLGVVTQIIKRELRRHGFEQSGEIMHER